MNIHYGTLSVSGSGANSALRISEPAPKRSPQNPSRRRNRVLGLVLLPCHLPNWLPAGGPMNYDQAIMMAPTSSNPIPPKAVPKS